MSKTSNNSVINRSLAFIATIAIAAIIGILCRDSILRTWQNNTHKLEIEFAYTCLGHLIDGNNVKLKEMSTADNVLFRNQTQFINHHEMIKKASVDTFFFRKVLYPKSSIKDKVIIIFKQEFEENAYIDITLVRDNGNLKFETIVLADYWLKKWR